MVPVASPSAMRAPDAFESVSVSVSPSSSWEPGDGWLRPSSYQDAPSPITTKTMSLSGRSQPPPQMPTDNESNNSDPAPPSPGGETPNFRTNIGDFPHQLPPKAF